jgi:tRNA A-37 threonylcarbamoyl transferase component Bud32
MERFTARTEELGHRSQVTGHRGEGSDSGFVLGRYLLQRRLGAGGYGVVWLGWDERLEREVAVKVIPREGAGGPAPARAEREARVAARLNHPGIVSLYELGADEEAVYLVSELVRGRTFAELLKGGALSDRDVARIGIALCQALDHAHDKGVIHRDVKPQNVMVVAEPAVGAGFAKLTDFGVAHLAESDLTRTGDVVGTLAYMAPEQAEGQRITEAVDVYSLALTLYEGWTGSNPVKARGPAATARNLGRTLPRLSSRRRDLPERLCQAIDAALDPRPDRRPSLELLRHSLEHASKELSEEGGLVEAETLRRFGLAERERRPREPIAVPARAVAAVAAGLLVFLALDLLGPAPPVAPVAAAGAAALAVALLPRIGWLACAVGVIGWIAASEPGTALVLAVAAAAVPLFLFRAGALWSIPALGPALGAIGLGPMYVAVAGMGSRSAWRRAGLGAAGFLWLAAAEVVTGHSLLYGVADGTQPRARWDGSVTHAAAHAIYPALSGPALAPAAVFAAFAVLLPVAVRGRNLTLDAILAATWAAGLVATLHATDGLLAANVHLAAARGSTAGALLGAALAVAAAHVRSLGAPVTPSTVP